MAPSQSEARKTVISNFAAWKSLETLCSRKVFRRTRGGNFCRRHCVRLLRSAAKVSLQVYQSATSGKVRWIRPVWRLCAVLIHKFWSSSNRFPNWKFQWKGEIFEQPWFGYLERVVRLVLCWSLIRNVTVSSPSMPFYFFILCRSITRSYICITLKSLNPHRPVTLAASSDITHAPDITDTSI